MKAKSMFVFAFLVLLTGVALAAAIGLPAPTAGTGAGGGGGVATYFPEKINFQGYLTDTGGTALNGSYDITLKLYSAATGGTALSTDTHTAVTVTNGVFNVQLGENLTAGWSSNFSNYSTIYLGVSVGTDAELSPRTLLVAVPYAFMAKNVSGESVVVASTSGTGIVSRANQTNGAGIYGLGQHGVIGSSEGANGTAVSGTAYGTSSIGVYGYSTTGDGVRGLTNFAGGSGVFGTADLNSAYGISAVNTTATTGTHAGAALLISGKIKANTGTNMPVGTGSIAEGASSAAIANTSVSADSLIFLTINKATTVSTGGIRVSAITLDTGFTVSTMDGNNVGAGAGAITFNYLIIN